MVTSGEQEMTGEGRVPAGIDVSMANAARIYDFFLGGKDNFPADREAAARVLAIAPQVPLIARQNRAFLGRVVRFLVEEGIEQFLDIGTGLPTEDNVHQVAQRVAPTARVVYVDNDPVACAHARALRAGPATAVVEADLRHPGDILGAPDVHRLIDFERPVAVLLVAVLHFVADEEDPAGVVARLREAMAPGSYLALSHFAPEDQAEAAEQVEGVARQAGLTGVTLRRRETILGFFDGLELVKPGLVSAPDWRPDPAGWACETLKKDKVSRWFNPHTTPPNWVVCGVGRKP